MLKLVGVFSQMARAFFQLFSMGAS